MNRCSRGIVFLLACATAALTGCAGGPKPKPLEPEAPANATTRQSVREAALQTHYMAWGCEGTLRWRIGEKPVQQGRFFWQQSGASWVGVFHRTPEGGDGSGGLMFSPRGLFWLTPAGNLEPAPSTEADALMERTFGADGPWLDLVTWVRGKKATDGDRMEAGVDGLPMRLTRPPWTVSYRRWMLGSEPPMPEDVLIEGPHGLRIDVRLNAWFWRNPLPPLPGLIF